MERHSNNCIPKEPAAEVFRKACKKLEQPTHIQSGGKFYLTFQEFNTTFELNTKDPDVFRNEAKIMLAIKDWMASRKYSANEAFDRLIRSCDR